MDTTIFLFLDYDGTLTPIVNNPRRASLSSGRRRILKKLAAGRDIELAIVSGRSLKDVKAKVKIPGIHYVGNHGFEIDKWTHPQARLAKESIAKIIKALKKKTSKIKGIIFEDKGYTASIHYRMVPAKLHGQKMKSDLDILFEVFKETTHPFVIHKKIQVTYGKKVFEIRPPVLWNKGDAIKKLLSKNNFPIYIGDDVTDEDAFKAIGKDGLAICVGERKNTAAELSLPSIDAVYEFLKSLLKSPA